MNIFFEELFDIRPDFLIINAVNQQYYRSSQSALFQTLGIDDLASWSNSSYMKNLNTVFILLSITFFTIETSARNQPPAIHSLFLFDILLKVTEIVDILIYLEG